MGIKSVNEIRGSEVLAEPILTKENEILIPKGSILKKEYLPLIRTLGIHALAVEDPYEKYGHPNTIIEFSHLKLLEQNVKQIMENHIYHKNSSLRGFEVIANEIVKTVQQLPEDRVMDVTPHGTNLYEHTVIVTLLSVILARKMKMDERSLYEIAVGGLLHDLGLRYITVNYMEPQWENADMADVFEYKKHTILGYTALEQEKWVPDIARKMVLFHHERLDRTGFPMKRNDFECACKIIQVCDAFDMLVTGMETKRTTVEAARTILRDEAKFDAAIAGLLLDRIAYFPVGTIMELDGNQKGMVVSQTNDPKHPVVMELEKI